MAPVTTVNQLSGRENELRSLEDFLERAAAAPSVLVLSGEAGIGKTELWQAGLQQAGARGTRVLAHRAVEAEAALSFAGIGELLSPVAADVLPALDEPRRRALEAALLIEGSGGDRAVEPRAIGLAVLDVLKALAADAPVLVAVDDFHWLDRPSARTLLFVLRRVPNERVGALLAVRGGLRELDGGLAPDSVDWLSVGPLAPTVLFQILKHRLGLELSPPQLTQLWEMTGGNPFFALEIGRKLSLTLPAPGRSLPVPGSLREIVGAGLARLPPASREVLLFVAALARPTVQALVAAHGERAEVLHGLEQAARAGVVEFDCERVPIPCSRRSATKTRRRGDAARRTLASLPWRTTRRSGRVTWRSPPRGQTRPWPRHLTGRRRTRWVGARRPPLRSSARSPRR